jgi:hypothetical protein
MFHFPALPPAALCIQAGATAHHGRRVTPFGNPRITAWLPAPRGISQAPASFLGSWCQGIHRAPLKTWHTTTNTTYAEEPPATPRQERDTGAPGTRCSRPLCSSQETDSNPTPARRRPARPARENPAPGSTRSLRTQQRAHPAPPPAPPFQAGKPARTGQEKETAPSE